MTDSFDRDTEWLLDFNLSRLEESAEILGVIYDWEKVRPLDSSSIQSEASTAKEQYRQTTELLRKNDYELEDNQREILEEVENQLSSISDFTPVEFEPEDY